MAATSRFVEISKEFLDILLDNSVPEKTKKATKYGMKIFNGKYFLLKKWQLCELLYFVLFPNKINNISSTCNCFFLLLPFSVRLVGWY